MGNSYFRFKQFTVHQDRAAMKVTTDGCLFGAWAADKLQRSLASTMLDIGTGTGLLSLMVAQKSGVTIDAVEIEQEAAAQAQINFANSPWADRISLLHSDIRSYEEEGKKYDVIISNPPFYEHELSSPSSAKNIAHHGEGLLLQELPAIIHRILKKDGNFYLLLPYKRMNEAIRLFHEQNLAVLEMVLVRQSTGHGPFRVMLRGKHGRIQETEALATEIVIKDEEGQYTAEFRSLLDEYYLYL